MQTTPHIIKILAATIAMLLVTQVAVLATTTRRAGGPVTALRTVSDTRLGYTQSTSFVAVPGMEMTIRVPEGEQAQLLITFSAVATCADDVGGITAWCQVQVLVDGVLAAPGTVQFDAAPDGNALEANSMQFVSGPLAAGEHLVRVKHRIDQEGEFYLGRRTLTVLRSRV